MILIPILALAQEPQFPQITSANLNGVKLQMPGDFAGERNLLLIAFQQDQQKDVDTWLKAMPAIARDRASFRYYELPTLSKMNPMVRFFIDNGMRGGIPDKQQRARTITLYIDKEPFKKSLGLGPEDRIYSVLVDKTGRILWREEGLFSEAKGKSLEAALSN